MALRRVFDPQDSKLPPPPIPLPPEDEGNQWHRHNENKNVGETPWQVIRTCIIVIGVGVCRQMQKSNMEIKPSDRSGRDER